jgi:hypothetical protein
MKTSESIVEVAKALAAFQSEVKQPEKDGNNPHFKSKYVTLDGTVKAIHDCAPKFGLSYTQMPVSNENGVGVITVIFHSSGQFIEFEPFILPLDKKTAQGTGSSLTYARRYALSAAFGIVSDVDDDGNEATANAPDAKPVSSKQVGLIKMQTKKIASARSVDDVEVYAKLGFEDVTKLTSQQASKAIETLNKWVDQLQAGA